VDAAKQRLPNTKTERDTMARNEKVLRERVAVLETSLRTKNGKVGEARHRQSNAKRHSRLAEIVNGYKEENNVEGIIGRVVSGARLR